MSTLPAVSVVIPTTGTRPSFLQRAIASALAGMPAGSVEVIVVGNGMAATDALDLGETDGNPHVRVLRVAQAQANLARNAGLEVALGEYVRFLDDDDFLEPGAVAQYPAMQAAAADICTGSVHFVDADEHVHGGYSPLPGHDFVVEIFRQRASTLPVAHVFRRAFLATARWDPARPYLQDVDWMHGLMRRGEMNWLPMQVVVGAWRHHPGARISVDHARRSNHDALKQAASIIEASVDSLGRTGRLDAMRNGAAAKALWDYAHQGFAYSPIHWQHIAAKARALDPSSRPANPRFNSFPLRLLNPLLLEWTLYPVRAVARVLASWAAFGRHPCWALDSRRSQ